MFPKSLFSIKLSLKWDLVQVSQTILIFLNPLNSVYFFIKISIYIIFHLFWSYILIFMKKYTKLRVFKKFYNWLVNSESPCIYLYNFLHDITKNLIKYKVITRKFSLGYRIYIAHTFLSCNSFEFIPFSLNYQNCRWVSMGF